MVKHLQNLQLSILVSLVLENFLDGNCLASFRNGSLEHDPERPISNNFLGIICETLLLEKKIEVSNVKLGHNKAIDYLKGLKAGAHLQRVACFCGYPGLSSPSCPPIDI